MRAKELPAPGGMDGDELFQKQLAEHPREHAHRQEEARPAGRQNSKAIPPSAWSLSPGSRVRAWQDIPSRSHGRCGALRLLFITWKPAWLGRGHSRRPAGSCVHLLPVLADNKTHPELALRVRADHNHAVAERKLGVNDLAVFAAIDRMLLEAEGLTQPRDRSVSVAIAHAGYHGSCRGFRSACHGASLHRLSADVSRAGPGVRNRA